MDAHHTAIERELEALPESLAEGLRLLAVRRLGNIEDVEDVVQEILARAVEAVRDGRVPEGVALGAYVRGIAHNVIVDLVRKRARGPREVVADFDRLPSRSSSALDTLVRREDVAAVRGALDRLTLEERRLLERVYGRGERIVDVAADTGEPAERLRKRKSRALERLRTLLAGGVP